MFGSRRLAQYPTTMRLSVRPLLLQLAWHVLAILIFPVPAGAQVESALVGAAARRVARDRRADRWLRQPPRWQSWCSLEPTRLAHSAAALAIALGTFGLFMLVLLLTRLGAPRYLLLPDVSRRRGACAVGSRTAHGAGRRHRGSRLVLLGVAALAGRVAFAPPKKAAKVVATNVKTAFYVLRVRSHEGASRSSGDPRRRTGSARRSHPARHRRWSSLYAAHRGRRSAGS